MLPINYTNIINDVNLLETYIKDQATKYYSDGTNELEDEEFDALINKLRILNPNSEVLKTGWGFEVQGNKVKHKYMHIGSLDKAKTFEEIPDRFKYKKIYISPKLDGLSAVCYYVKGNLVKAITRGNGEYGKDITDKMKIIEGANIPDTLFTGAVRGELIINNNNWNILKDKYGNQYRAPRNLAAGIINRDYINEDIQFIDFVTYKITGQENNPVKTDRSAIIIWLQQNFKHAIPEYYYPQLNKASWNDYHLNTFESFKQLGYGLDGLVLTPEEIPFNYNTRGYMYDEEAFKFASDITNTVIKEIEWTLSRTQRMVPVAIVEPVELAGAVINRVTCNNARMVQDLGLGIDASVEITRSNEVIPKILTVLEPSKESLPQTCPLCKSLLVWDGVDLKCENKECPNIKLSDLQQWCETIGETDGLQWTLMKQYLDIYEISDINTLYEKEKFVMHDLCHKELSITEQKILEFFKKLYIEPVDCEKALNALNIPRLGDKTSIILSCERTTIIGYFIYCYNKKQGYDIDKEIYHNRFLDTVKEATTKSIEENEDKFINLKYLFSNDLQTNRIIFPEKRNREDIKYVAVTGSLNTMKRKDFEKHISQYGYELSSNLKKCTYLITNDPTSGSSKNKQAQEYNIPLITEIEFLEKLK